MKSLLLALALTSSSVFAIDLVDLEAKYCGHSVEQNGSNLRTYPLFYDITSDGEYFIQNQMIEGRKTSICLSTKTKPCIW